MRRIKLGETRRFGETDYVATSWLADQSLISEFLVWTPIPEGMTAQDVGRRFPAAMWTAALEPEDTPGA